jgi:hypothetical protein
MFQKLGLFLSSSEGGKAPTQLVPLERKIQFPKHYVFYFLEYWMMEKVQKLVILR